MQRNVIETILGAVVLLVAGSFVLFAINLTQRSSDGSYDINASFLQTPGLQKGAPVQLAGVQVGYVSRVAVDPASFDVEVRMEIDENVRLPIDSSASLSSDGAFGDTSVALHRGSSPDSLEKGGFLARTVSPVNLIDQIGRFVYGSNL